MNYNVFKPPSFFCVVFMTLSFLLVGLPAQSISDPLPSPPLLNPDPTEFSERQLGPGSGVREWYQDYQDRDDAALSRERAPAPTINYNTQLKSEESISSSVSVRPDGQQRQKTAIENGWIPITKARFPSAQSVDSQKFQFHDVKPGLRKQPTVNLGYGAPVTQQSPAAAVATQTRPQKTHSAEIWNELQNKFNLIDQKSQQEEQAIQQQWREQELKREQMEVQQIILALEQSKQKLLPHIQQQPQVQPHVVQQQLQIQPHVGQQQLHPVQQTYGAPSQQQQQPLQQPIRPQKRPNKFRRPPKEPLVNFRPPPMHKPRGKGLKPILQKQRNKIRQLLRPRNKNSRGKPNKQQQLQNFQQQVKQQHNNLQQTLQQSQHQNNMMSQPSQQYSSSVLPPQQQQQEPLQQQYNNNAQQQQPLQQLQQQYDALTQQQGYNNILQHKRVQEIQQKAYDSIPLPPQPLQLPQQNYPSPLPPINLPLQHLQQPHPLQPFQQPYKVPQLEILNPDPTVPLKLHPEPVPSSHSEVELTSPPELAHHHQEGPVLLGVTTKICVEEQIGPTRIFEVKTIRTGKICKVKVKRFSHCPQGETYITMDDNSNGACNGINNMLNFGKLLKESAGQLYNFGVLSSEYAVNALGTIVDFYSHPPQRPEVLVKVNVKH